jgi:hypothetical protein
MKNNASHPSPSLRSATMKTLLRMSLVGVVLLSSGLMTSVQAGVQAGNGSGTVRAQMKFTQAIEMVVT